MAIDINTLSDPQLQRLAAQFGISQPSYNPLPGLVQFGQAPYGAAPIQAAPTISPLGLTVGAPPVTVPAGIRTMVREAYEPATQQALEDLRMAAQSEADRRGMDIADTPIGQSYLRQVSRLRSGIAGQEAQSVLGLIGQREKLLQQQAEAQERARQVRFGLESGDILNRARLQQEGGQFAERSLQARSGLAQKMQEQAKSQQIAAQQFQEGLRQQAFQNRMALGGMAGDLGLGLGRLRQPAGTITTAAPSLTERFGGVAGGLIPLSLGLSGVNLKNILGIK
jgi:hypothetical protein